MSTMSVPTRPRSMITFGIELEFIIIIRKRALIAWNEQRGILPDETELYRNHYMREYVAAILSTYNSNPYNPVELPTPPFTWKNMSLGTVIHTEPKESDYRFWSVCKEPSIGVFTSDILRTFNISRRNKTLEAHFDQEFWYDGAELVSSVLCTEAAFQWALQLQRVNKILHNAADDVRWVPENVDILCRTPRQGGCGLHVHIGYGTEVIPWQVVQTIYILWGIYEEEIQGFHPIERRSSHNDYALSLRTRCQPFSYKNFAQGVMWAKDPETLMHILVPPGSRARDLKIGISEARGDGVGACSKRQTLEFREAAGTIDHAHIKWWIKFIEAFVIFAQSLVDIQFDLVGDLYDSESGRPGLMLCESIFDHISLVTLNQEGRDFFLYQTFIYGILASPTNTSGST